MKPVNEAGAELMAATWLFDELCVPADFGTRDVAAQAIRLEAKRRGGIERAAKYILGRAIIDQRSGVTVNRFWFTDQKYNAQGPDNPGVSEMRRVSDAEAYTMWQGMSAKYKRENPWKGAI